MAEKHLAELGWKAFVVRHKLKDEGLTKALVVWAKLGDGGDPGARLAALDEIATIVKKLRKDKAISAKEDAAEWLGEMVKETAKVRLIVEALAKSAASRDGAKAKADARRDDAKEQGEKESHEKRDDDDESGDLGARLLAGLGRVKAAAGEAELPFLAVPGAPAWALVVARKVAPGDRKLLAEAVKGPKAPITGTCVLRDGKFTFVVAVVKGGLAAGLAGAIRHWTKKRFPVVVTDGKTTLDDESDTASDGADAGEPSANGPPQSGTAPRVQATAPKRGLASWAAARTEVVAKLKAVAAELNSAQHPEKDKAVIQLGAVARQLTAQPAELRQVDELERWLRDDDVVADICDIAFDLRTPLLGALAEIRRDLTPAK